MFGEKDDDEKDENDEIDDKDDDKDVGEKTGMFTKCIWEKLLCLKLVGQADSNVGICVMAVGLQFLLRFSCTSKKDRCYVYRGIQNFT